MMKATRSSARIKSTNSISNVNCNEKNYTKETELENNNRKKNKSRAVNFVSNVENNQSLMNCQEIDQVSDVPVEKKLNFKDLRQELLVANANPTQKQNEDTPKEIFRNLNIMRTELRQLEDPPVSKSEKDLMSARLDFSFFNKPCEELALSLLGKIFVRQLEDGTVLKGRIVETESYIGTVDKASQTYDYRISATNLPLYMPPGTIYIYSTYGMYHCINISSQPRCELSVGPWSGRPCAWSAHLGQPEVGPTSELITSADLWSTKLDRLWVP
ncbi:DNA-3-methyladenine glycosylase-like [Leptopilina boulardi]|uniref:DNA-3-methyladenine glycosylase-like n=1 Tax=Leptopilina boulardi TaxID=63433 RepID=UPI0021F60F7C|nr:DNA-3-methyladenine glycosylase-like [Leptopilina boulardi]XP_051170524.1 DNA-3-methyladenine glycosylase-like [Leptopilina boulardi]